MGIKLEAVIVLFIVIIVSTTYFFKISDIKSTPADTSKQLEFKKTTLIEVDTERMLSNIDCSYGVKKNDTLSLSDIVYYSKNINSLRSKSGSYSQGILYLDGDIKLKQKDGYTYNAEHAVYNTKDEILKILTGFTININKSVIGGAELEYNAKTKVVKSKNINAIVYTAEK